MQRRGQWERARNLWHQTAMALPGCGLGDRLPSYDASWRRPRHRSFGLDGDEAPDPNRGSALDHGIEVGVREDRLEERDADLGLALDRSIREDASHHAPTAHLDHLDLVFRSVGNGDAVLTGANAKHAGQVVTLGACDDDLAIGRFGYVNERPEHARPSYPPGRRRRKPPGSPLYSPAWLRSSADRRCTARRFARPPCRCGAWVAL